MVTSGVTKGSFWYGGAARHLQNPPHSYTWALKIGTYSYTSHSKLPPIHIRVWHIEQLLGKINKPIYTKFYLENAELITYNDPVYVLMVTKISPSRAKTKDRRPTPAPI